MIYYIFNRIRAISNELWIAGPRLLTPTLFHIALPLWWSHHSRGHMSLFFFYYLFIAGTSQESSLYCAMFMNLIIGVPTATSLLLLVGGTHFLHAKKESDMTILNLHSGTSAHMKLVKVGHNIQNRCGIESQVSPTTWEMSRILMGWSSFRPGPFPIKANIKVQRQPWAYPLAKLFSSLYQICVKSGMAFNQTLIEAQWIWLSMQKARPMLSPRAKNIYLKCSQFKLGKDQATFIEIWNWLQEIDHYRFTLRNLKAWCTVRINQKTTSSLVSDPLIVSFYFSLSQ